MSKVRSNSSTKSTPQSQLLNDNKNQQATKPSVVKKAFNYLFLSDYED